MVNHSDYLIIGAGIVGLTLARELLQRDPGAQLTVIDKEPAAGRHASTRNSGVLHSGIYYTADSFKARFTRDGNQAWQAYCEERGLALERCGKLVVTRNEQEEESLQVLEQRAAANGVTVERLNAQQARALEPRARTCDQALFIPSTATIDPQELINTLEEELRAAGTRLLYGHPYRQRLTRQSGAQTIEAGTTRLSAGKIINCAGLYADRIAHDFGFGMPYSVLPFKGLYLYASANAPAPRAHIYPVPDLATPFLGVHVTRTIDGRAKIGPTATPALWREHYGGLRGFRFDELREVLGHELYMLATNRNQSRTLARQELKKRRREEMISAAAQLIDDAASLGFHHWGAPGIRAQLIDRRSRSLVMDFVVEGDAHSLHILNAVSPALTCALPFARYLATEHLGLSEPRPIEAR
ncbi:FAD-dependent oxidoreductase [Halorhodospira abdelmalekii]|uniref:L-2-hydroxyglutarate oxidase n=1 Tax=Halorhodospira abdelmalekii TaxID=421629 RepID=UPI0019086CA0|nr:L-2-hydroxyglutarate oxidase [Halorhodospira abdelmalekii]MBK1733890.1 FAD-dependent oxidoreductase [Halorhodospira abdelmalekii]